MSKKMSYIDLSERKLLLRIIDTLTVIISLWVGSVFFNIEYIDFRNSAIYQWLMTLSVYILLFGEIFEMYNLNVSNNRFKITRSIVLTMVTITVVYVFSPYITPSLPENRLQIIYFFLFIIIPVIFWRFIYIYMFFSPRFFKNIVVIGHHSKTENLLNLIKEKGFDNVPSYISTKRIKGFEAEYTSIGKVNLLESVKKAFATEIIVSSIGFSTEVIQKLNKDLILLFEEGINIKSFETYYEEITNRVPKEYLDHNFYKKITFSKRNNSKLYLFIHRVLDIVISFIGSALFLGIIPFVYIGNLIANRGPLFYGQERVGKKGKIFKILKLRSMVTNAEKNGVVWAKKDDVRITKFGRFLRLTRLDEIPQFYNILKGDMSLIGPRPERPEFVRDLKEKIPFYAIRHVVRPGLTGWAQVNYQYANTIEEQETKLRYDLYYIKERSAFLDFKILIKTISTVLFFKGQ